MTRPLDSEIETRAYFLWEREGRPHGRDQAHWFEAEAQLAPRGTPSNAGAKARAKAAKPKAPKPKAAKRSAPT